MHQLILSRNLTFHFSYVPMDSLIGYAKGKTLIRLRRVRRLICVFLFHTCNMIPFHGTQVKCYMMKKKLVSVCTFTIGK